MLTCDWKWPAQNVSTKNNIDNSSYSFKPALRLSLKVIKLCDFTLVKMPKVFETFSFVFLRRDVPLQNLPQTFPSNMYTLRKRRSIRRQAVWQVSDTWCHSGVPTVRRYWHIMHFSNVFFFFNWIIITNTRAQARTERNGFQGAVATFRK